MNHGCLVGTIYRLYQKKIHLGSFVLFAVSQGKEDRSVKVKKWSEKLNQDRFKFMGKFQEVLEYYNLHYKECEGE